MATPVISEFMASNKTVLADKDGDYSDWIELHNPDAIPVDLSGWYLSDNQNKKTKWQFPAGVSLPADGYLVVFASGKNLRSPEGELHTNFSLSKEGEYLGLTAPDGKETVHEFAPAFPGQEDDVAYGASSDGTSIGFLAFATPGAANSPLASSGSTQVDFSVPAGTFSGLFSLELTGATEGQIARYLVSEPGPDALGAANPTSAWDAYSSSMTFAGSVVVRAAMFNANGVRQGPVTTKHYMQVDPAVADFASTLPILVLDNHGAGPLPIDDDDHPGWLHVFAPGSSGLTTLLSPTACSTPMVYHIHGSSSALFPKKSYTIELHDDQGGHNPQSLLGLPAHEDWTLVSPWYFDSAYIRNSYVYGLSAQLGHWAPKTKFVEVFSHDDGQALGMNHYAGISVLTQRVKVGPNAVNITPLSSDNVTGGYILELDNPDPDRYSFTTNRGFPDYSVAGTVIQVAEPKANKLSEAHRDYIRGYVQQMEDALYSDRDSGWTTHRYQEYIDLPSWVDAHLLNILVSNADGPFRSFYFYKDRDGKLVAGPVWDFDKSLGSVDPRTADSEGWTSPLGIDRWTYGWYGLMAQDPEFMQTWVDRWQTQRLSVLNTTNLQSLADSLAAEIPADAAARDVARWPDNTSRFGSGFLGEVSHLKEWIAQRADWIDRQFVPRPGVESGDDNLIMLTPPADTEIIYTLDGTDPRSVGGSIAPNAFRTSGPIKIPVSSSLRVRAYRQDWMDRFPGGPWSSLATLSDTSKVSQLAHVSSRGVAGDGGESLITGTIVKGSGPQRFLIRALGPTLGTLGVNNPLPDPVLSVVDSAGNEIARNRGWMNATDPDELKDAAATVGAAALSIGSNDSAMIVTLPPGAYTAQVSSASGKSGAALSEFYPLGEGSRFANVSTRSVVQAGDGLLIGGIVIRGDRPKKLLFRAVGPSLAAFGVENYLAQPALQILSASEVVATQAGWDSDSTMAETTRSTGAFPLAPGSDDAALILSLPPGSYTLEVTSRNHVSGVALVEVYEIP